MNIAPRSIIQKLWDYGHFHNPHRRYEVTETDLPKLSLTDKAVQDAIRSFQQFMKPDLDMYAEIYHMRSASADGVIGPATADLIEAPRCGAPDYQMAGMEEGNWPPACRGRLRFGRSFQALPNLSAADTDRGMWASANNWTYALADLDMVVAPVGDQNVHRYADVGALAGSTLAWSYLARNNCNDRLAQRYNTRVTWTLQLAATVISHEDGHALGLPHNNDASALMYPSIHAQSRARLGYPNSTDLRVAQGLGYKLSGAAAPSRDHVFTPRPHGEPTPPPGPDPNPSGIWFGGELVAYDGDNEIQRFILVKKPEV